MKNKKAYKLIVFFIIAITFMIPKEAFASPHLIYLLVVEILQQIMWIV